LFDDQHKTKVLLEQTSIQFATTLDSIWTLRNKVVHENFKFNVLVQIGNLEVRIIEHIQALVESADADDSICSKVWNAPPLGIVKLNVDARIRVDQAAIAVVARNHRGFIIKAWAKLIDFSDPTMAEAAAITWALELAVIEKFEHICIESDAKVYVDALAAPIDDCLWKIRALISMSLKLALKFSSCNFHWVKRNANQVAHVLAKVAFSLTHPFVCSASSLPTSVVEA
jgi:ribonuclease HI